MQKKNTTLISDQHVFQFICFHPYFMPVEIHGVFVYENPRLHGSSEMTFLRLVTKPGLAALGFLGILHMEAWEILNK